MNTDACKYKACLWLLFSDPYGSDGTAGAENKGKQNAKTLKDISVKVSRKGNQERRTGK
jgi:hypothetical protein